jgi:hypothetical protein
MAIWNCKIGASGALTMSSEPSVRCDPRDPVYARLYPWSVGSIVLYGLGIPLLFVYVLTVYKNEVKADQALRINGLGDSPEDNPQLSVRKRYQKLYNDFRCVCVLLLLLLLVLLCVYVCVSVHVCAYVCVCMYWCLFCTVGARGGGWRSMAHDPNSSAARARAGPSTFTGASS